MVNIFKHNKTLLIILCLIVSLTNPIAEAKKANDIALNTSATKLKKVVPKKKTDKIKKEPPPPVIVHVCIYDSGLVEYRDTPCQQSRSSHTLQFTHELSHYTPRERQQAKQEIYRYLRLKQQERRLNQAHNRRSSSACDPRKLAQQKMKLRHDIETINQQLRQLNSAKRSGQLRLKLRQKMEILASLN